MYVYIYGPVLAPAMHSPKKDQTTTFNYGLCGACLGGLGGGVWEGIVLGSIKLSHANPFRPLNIFPQAGAVSLGLQMAQSRSCLYTLRPKVGIIYTLGAIGIGT